MCKRSVPPVRSKFMILSEQHRRREKQEEKKERLSLGSSAHRTWAYERHRNCMAFGMTTSGQIASHLWNALSPKLQTMVIKPNENMPFDLYVDHVEGENLVHRRQLEGSQRQPAMTM